MRRKRYQLTSCFRRPVFRDSKHGKTRRAQTLQACTRPYRLARPRPMLLLFRIVSVPLSARLFQKFLKFVLYFFGNGSLINGGLRD